MSKTFRHKFKNGNVVEMQVFENDPNGQTADLLIRCHENEAKSQRFLCKIVHLDQTMLLIELRNDIVSKSKGSGRRKRR